MNWGLSDFYAGDADDGTRYVVIFIGDERPPHAVVRVRDGVEEAFTHRLVWGPSDLLARAATEETWTARDAEVGYANGFLVEIARRVRAAKHESALAEYRYHAVFKDTAGVVDLDNAYLLIRVSEQTLEEVYLGNRRWGPTDKLYRLSSGRDWTEESVAIGEVEAERLQRRFDEKRDVGVRLRFVSAGGRAMAVVRSGDGAEPWESAFVGRDRWTPSKLLAGLPADSPWTVEDVDRERATEHMAALVRQDRDDRRAEFAAGYAVFRRPTDVLDLDSAHEVVEELAPGHEVAVRIDVAERERLLRRIHAREARRRVGGTGDHTCFAVFSIGSDIADVDTAFAVIRCPTGEPGRWETFLRDGEWPPTIKPGVLQILPVGVEDVDRITRRIAASEQPRHFAIRDENGPVALVRLTGTTEETAHDLGWEPSALLDRWRDESTWRVIENDESGMTVSRFHNAMFGRAAEHRPGGRWVGEHEYFAVFEDQAAALDLDNAVAVVRRKDDVEEEFTRPHGWVPTETSRLVGGPARNSQHLAISPEEAERLTTRTVDESSRGIRGAWRSVLKKWKG